MEEKALPGPGPPEDRQLDGAQESQPEMTLPSVFIEREEQELAIEAEERLETSTTEPESLHLRTSEPVEAWEKLSSSDLELEKVEDITLKESEEPFVSDTPGEIESRKPISGNEELNVAPNLESEVSKPVVVKNERSLEEERPSSEVLDDTLEHKVFVLDKLQESVDEPVKHPFENELPKEDVHSDSGAVTSGEVFEQPATFRYLDDDLAAKFGDAVVGPEEKVEVEAEEGRGISSVPKTAEPIESEPQSVTRPVTYELELVKETEPDSNKLEDIQTSVSMTEVAGPSDPTGITESGLTANETHELVSSSKVAEPEGVEPLNTDADTIPTVGEDLVIEVGEALVAKENTEHEETPIAEEVPFIEEVLAVEVPVVEETLVIKETPEIEETPIVEEISVVQEVPIAEVPDIGEVPITREISEPEAEEAPVTEVPDVEDTPTGKQTLVLHV